MTKNILSVTIFLFSLIFFYFVVNIYFSEQQKKKVKKNREVIMQEIRKNINKLPVLVNDTNNIIIFNLGFENKDNKIERNFWKLFKNND